MNNHKRKARTLSIWSAVLLLAAVAAYLGGFTGAAWTAALPFVATTLVVASAATAMGAVASGSRPMNGGKRTVLLWSSGALTLELAFVVIAWGLETTVVSAACDGAYLGSAENCGYAYAYLLVGFGGLVAIAAIIALLGAVFAGLINAGQGGERWWFATILTSLLGAVAVVGWDALVLRMPQLEGYSSLESVQGWLILVAPLLLSMLTLMFSLVGARQPARS